MSKISDFASNSVMGVVRKIVNYITSDIDPTLSDAVDHLPSRFHGTFDDNTRNLQLTIESQGTSTEDLVATVNIPAGEGGSGGPTYSAGNGINITSANAIEIDTAVTATKQSVETLQDSVGDCFNDVTYDSVTNKITFTALYGQSNAITLESDNSEWKNLTMDNIGTVIKNAKIGLKIRANTDITTLFTPCITVKDSSDSVAGSIASLKAECYALYSDAFSTKHLLFSCSGICSTNDLVSATSAKIFVLGAMEIAAKTNTNGDVLLTTLNVYFKGYNGGTGGETPSGNYVQNVNLQYTY